MNKVFIEVRGGLIQNIQSTSEDIVIYVKDYDIKFDPACHETEEGIGWQYWESNGDQIVNDAEFQDAIVNADK